MSEVKIKYLVGEDNIIKLDVLINENDKKDLQKYSCMIVNCSICSEYKYNDIKIENSETIENSNYIDIFIDERYQYGKIYILYYNNDHSKFYIGQTIQKKLSFRFSSHKNKAETEYTLIAKNLRELGKHNFSIKLLENYSCNNKVELSIREEYWIQRFKPTFNVATAKIKHHNITSYAQGKIYKLYYKYNSQIFYIGSTKLELIDRYNNHKRKVNELSKSLLYKTMYKLGVDNFIIEIIEEYPCTNYIQLLAREQYWIQKLQPSLNTAVASLLTCEEAALYKSGIKPSKERISCKCGLKIRRGDMDKHNQSYIHKIFTDDQSLISSMNNDIIKCICGRDIDKYNYSRHLTGLLHINIMKIRDIKTSLLYLSDIDIDEIRSQFPASDIDNENKISCACGMHLAKIHSGDDMKEHMQNSNIHNKFMQFIKPYLDKIDLTKYEKKEYKIPELNYSSDDKITCAKCGFRLSVKHYIKHISTNLHTALIPHMELTTIIKQIGSDIFKQLNIPIYTNTYTDKNYTCICGTFLSLPLKGSTISNHNDTIIHKQYVDCIKSVSEKHINGINTMIKYPTYENIQIINSTQCIMCQCGLIVSCSTYNGHFISEIHKNLLKCFNIKKRLYSLPESITKQIDQYKSKKKITLNSKKTYFKCICESMIITNNFKYSTVRAHLESALHITYLKQAELILSKYK